MAQDPPTVRDIVSRSFSRAVAPQKLVKLVRAVIGSADGTPESSADELCAALLDLLVLDPSALLSAYLSTCVSSSLLPIQTVLTHTLFRIAGAPLALGTLVAISDVVVSATSGLAESQTIPALLTPPPQLVPDIGGSSPTPISTLNLLLPLLRLSALPDTPPPIIALTSRTLSLLSPFPSPPLEVGLEASALLPSLPPAVFGPLRNCLAGLMADITLTQGVTQAAVAALGDGAAADSKTAPGATETLPPLPRIWTTPRARSPIPTQHAVTFALAYLHHARSFARAIPTAPGLFTSHLAILAMGRYLEPSPAGWLLHLLENAILGVMDRYQGLGPEYVEKMLFLVEEIPLLLKWWKEHGEADWAIPTSLTEVLSTAFQTSSPSLTNYATWMNDTLEQRVSQAESEDELGGSYPVEGWAIRPLQDTLVARLLELGLLRQDEVNSILPDFDASLPSSGESLLNRLFSAPASHHPPIVLLISSAAGAARAFAGEFLQTIRDYPQKPLPDNVFTAVSSLPGVLATLSSAIPPSALVELLAEKLLETPDDQAARSEDPQGALTRFGESVVLVEAIAALFDVPLPHLLERARRAIGFGDLSEQEKECMNGWAKALFGSDGIDDEILLSTAPATFCRLASTLIQQAISATAVGIIDREALHGGLSYFSQPLLRWSLSGIAGWLCEEISRNGLVLPFLSASARILISRLISGLHLDVLQNLIVSDAISDTLLRVVGKDIARLLDPIRGLEPVFASASIDVGAIRFKLEGLGIRIEQTVLPIPSLENVLRAELQLLRRLDVAPLNWSGNLLSTLSGGLQNRGRYRIVTTLLEEVFSPGGVPIEGTGVDLAQDPLAYFAPVLLGVPITPEGPPLISTLVDTLLPASQNRQSQGAMSTLLKSSLLLADAIVPSSESASANPRGGSMIIAEHLVEDILETRNAQGEEKEKRTLGRKVDKPTREARAAEAALLGRALGNDEELQSRFAVLGRLVETT